jgi:hypothetical protein
MAMMFHKFIFIILIVSGCSFQEPEDLSISRYIHIANQSNVITINLKTMKVNFCSENCVTGYLDKEHKYNDGNYRFGFYACSSKPGLINFMNGEKVKFDRNPMCGIEESSYIVGNSNNSVFSQEIQFGPLNSNYFRKM